MLMCVHQTRRHLTVVWWTFCFEGSMPPRRSKWSLFVKTLGDVYLYPCSTPPLSMFTLYPIVNVCHLPRLSLILPSTSCTLSAIYLLFRSSLRLCFGGNTVRFLLRKVCPVPRMFDTLAFLPYPFLLGCVTLTLFFPSCF